MSGETAFEPLAAELFAAPLGEADAGPERLRRLLADVGGLPWAVVRA
jgi:hypothetical protein